MLWLQKNSADLVITDIYMDDMDGMQVIQALKRNFPSTKIIVMLPFVLDSGNRCYLHYTYVILINASTRKYLIYQTC